MKKIDLSTWARRPHYEFFRSFEKPFYDVAARVDLTPLVHYARSTDRSLFATMMHTILRTANATEGFRLRFRGDQVFEVDACDASFTIMGDNGLFNYATCPFQEDLDTFRQNVRDAAESTKGRTDLNLDDDHHLPLIYVTSMPWLDFQSITHAFSGDPDDCFPRIAWGKIGDHSNDNQPPRFETTVQVTTHHGLVDGFHAAQFFENLNRLVAQFGEGE